MCLCVSNAIKLSQHYKRDQITTAQNKSDSCCYFLFFFPGDPARLHLPANNTQILYPLGIKL